MAVLDVPSLVGEQLVLWHVGPVTRQPSHVYGYRGWRDVHHVGRDLVIEVVSEDDWQRHRLIGTPPLKAIRWPARAAWVA